MHAHLTAWLLSALVAALPYTLPPAEVAAILRSFHWTAAAAAHYAATVPVEVVPGLPRAGEYQPPAFFGAARVRVFMAAPYAVEHEMHHAWDDAHGFLEPAARPQREADLRRLADEDTAAGAAARRIVAAFPTDYTRATHDNHALIDALGHDPTALPAWYRERYVGYLAGHRLVVPVLQR